MTEDEDEMLWNAVTRDIKPLRGKRPVQKPAKKASRKIKPAIRETVSIKKAAAAPDTKATGKGLDRKTDEKLRKGRMEIEARLDLHGMRIPEAEQALTKFIQNAYKTNKRCVLVITGKGSRKNAGGEDWWEAQPGAIRTLVPQWLAGKALSALILQTHAARPQDGGEGALYVLLRRKRQ